MSIPPGTGASVPVPGAGPLGSVPTVSVVYSKEEGLLFFDRFDWLITDDHLSHGKSDAFDVVETVHGFQVVIVVVVVVVVVVGET